MKNLPAEKGKKQVFQAAAPICRTSATYNRGLGEDANKGCVEFYAIKEAAGHLRW